MPVVEVVQVVVMRDRAVTAAVTVDVVVFGQVVLPMRRVIHEPIHLPSGGAARRIREGNGQPASPANTGHRRYRRQRCPIQHDPVAVRGLLDSVDAMAMAVRRRRSRDGRDRGLVRWGGVEKGYEGGDVDVVADSPRWTDCRRWPGHGCPG